MEKSRWSGQPNQSDATLLLKVEDLINISFGTAETWKDLKKQARSENAASSRARHSTGNLISVPVVSNVGTKVLSIIGHECPTGIGPEESQIGQSTNVVNFKTLQFVLHILARRMRILEQDVELRFSEETDILNNLKATYGDPIFAEEEKVKKSPKSLDVKSGKGGKDGKGVKGVKGAKDKKMGKADDLSSGKQSTSPEDSGSHVGSIEVVTASQFNMLNKMVQHLLKRTGGVPLPTMPSNEDLLAELAQGTASLPDTMEAMQVIARVQAVEHAITKMACLLTELAASGVLPPSVAEIIKQMRDDLEQLALTTGLELELPTTTSQAEGLAIKPVNETTSKSSAAASHNVTNREMQDDGWSVPPAWDPVIKEALEVMRDELMKNMTIFTTKSEGPTIQASAVVNSVAQKMETAIQIDQRLNDILSLSADYDTQLRRFDEGLTLQLQVFKDQMSQLRVELDAGLQQVEAANNNSESNALIELKSGYESLVNTLEQTSSTHRSLLVLQKQLTDELKNLVECVELLREDKADRDEVADGLRDKANISRLKGLLRQQQFDEGYKQLEYKINLSYEKFKRQEETWVNVLDDLSKIVAKKASIDDLVALKEYATKTLSDQFEWLRYLEFLLGEPKTALLTRQLARNAYCGPCRVGALMEPFEKRSSVPPMLPSVRKDAGEPCKTSTVRQDAEAAGKHVCNRWVGGSHTVISQHVTHERANPVEERDVPTAQYIGVGQDGRIYHMEEELQPCLECNKIESSGVGDTVPPSEAGAGDMT